jgi:hypothetical protein
VLRNGERRIAANSTIFSWINSTLLDPIPGIAHTRDMITHSSLQIALSENSL